MESNNLDKINCIINLNNGYLTAKILHENGYYKNYLYILTKQKILKKVDAGIFRKANIAADKYYEISLANPKIVFSHLSALNLLHFWPNSTNIFLTVNNKYHNKKLNKYQPFYVDKKILDLGLIYVPTKYGNLVKTYDLERTICDIIRKSYEFDNELVLKILRKYLTYSKKDLDKLMQYATIMHIDKKLTEYLAIDK